MLCCLWRRQGGILEGAGALGKWGVRGGEHSRLKPPSLSWPCRSPSRKAPADSRSGRAEEGSPPPQERPRALCAHVRPQAS